MTPNASLINRLAWACLAGGAVVLVVALARFWGANSAYADRFLILIGAAWAAYTLAPSWTALPIRPGPLLGLPFLLVGVTAFPVGYFLLMQVGPRTLLLWWLAAALLAATSGFLLTRFGWPRWRAMAFPLLFPLFALPIPLRVLNPLQDQLQKVTTTCAQAGLSALGMTVTREEFVLALPSGKLLVEEACSGVRSITALVAIAAFVAFLKGFGPPRGTLLVLLAIPVVAAVNVLRVILSGLVQESAGPEYIRDDWHEALGFVMVLVGLVLVLGLARLLRSHEEEERETGIVSSSPLLPFSPSYQGGRLAAALLLMGAIGTIALGLMGRASESASLTTAPIEEISPKLGPWTGEDRAVPAVVSDLLAPDRVVHRYYENNIGDGVIVWVLYWNTGGVIKGYHHPDVCWGKKGFQATERWVEPIPVPGGGSIPATARAYQQEREQQTVLYWTQEGNHIWTDADEQADQTDTVTSSWYGHRWVGDLLNSTAQPRPARLTVVVVIPSTRPTARHAVADLTRRAATELYRVCPWAIPESPSGVKQMNGK